MSENYYSPPASKPVNPQEFSQQALNTMADHVTRTRGWLLFFVVMFGLMILLMLVAAVGMLVVGAGDNSLFGAGMAVVYLLVAVVYGLFGWIIYRVARAAGTVRDQPGAASLIEFCDQNRRMWKTWGMISITIMSLYIVGIVLAIAIPLLAA